MAVRRIVSNIGTSSMAEVRRFYETLFDLHPVMDHGWLVTLASGEHALTQVGIATEGGSGTPVPDLSIEVDDVDEVYRRAKSQGLDIVYELTDEPWGVRRFYLTDPTGKLLNVLSHRPDARQALSG
ncbi:glyoxalase [Pusillimonas caeni]|uniref:VOC family protein n=1 Tax=Pusillimonas caeni TaxID=1348472 RepID=UPI000E59AC02|nr:VOC family protein [Pusillimonas caeni]TFL13756.1 glyoxalase [Pusillimonas caeni]